MINRDPALKGVIEYSTATCSRHELSHVGYHVRFLSPPTHSTRSNRYQVQVFSSNETIICPCATEETCPPSRTHQNKHGYSNIKTRRAGSTLKKLGFVPDTAFGTLDTWTD